MRETGKTLFDVFQGEAEKERGMGIAANNRQYLLRFGRDLAVLVAQSRVSRECTADDVSRELVKNGYSAGALGPAAGSLFRGKQWEFTGQWVPSVRVTNHARVVRVWRLK